jgi:hypothetical protein
MGNKELIAITSEKTPVRKRPAPTIRIVPMAPNRETTIEPAKMPNERTSSNVEYVCPPWLDAIDPTMSF